MIVKVRNNNIYPFSAKFQGRDIHIPAGDYIEMDYEEAVLFRGDFHPIKRDNKGVDDPRFFKKIAIEFDPKDLEQEGHKKPSKFACQACGEQTSSWTELEAHSRLMHKNQLIEDGTRHEQKTRKSVANEA